MWQSAAPAISPAAFFALYAFTSLYLRALFVWHWPHSLVAIAADLPGLFLLVTAVGWRQQESSIPRVEKPQRRQECSGHNSFRC